MKTAGLALDFYDDPQGETLKSNCPTADDLPDLVKEAHILSPEEREVLRDEAYALILHDDGKQLRKFACVDAGNTILSTMYFLENAEKLPAEAIKVAAANLIAFNEEFGLPIPEELKLSLETGMPAYEKTAAPMVRKRDPFKQPYAGDEADWAQRTNLLPVRGGTDSGRIIATANALKTASVVDVSALEPAPVVKAKIAEKTALAGKYSLDSYSDVEDALRFFHENWMEMAPSDRHEFCVKTAARAEELDIEVSELVGRYGSEGYAPDVEAHLAARRLHAPEYAEVWEALSEKRASISPEQFVELLSKADESAGVNFEYGNGEICDPYLSTFGGRHETEKLAWAWESNDGEAVTEEQLRAIPDEKLEAAFEADFAKAFSLNPTLIFDSMPAEHKTIIANLARG